jgi:hypothetical protein
MTIPTIPPLRILKWLGAVIALSFLFAYTVMSTAALAVFVPIFWFLPAEVKHWWAARRARNYRVTDSELEEWLK